MKQVKVIVPGKIMLCGEYVVLFGAQALSATLSSHIEVDLCVDTDVNNGRFYIESYFLSKDPLTLEEAKIRFPKNPLVRVVDYCIDKYGIKAGKLILKMSSNFCMGMGSSSAIYLGTIIGFATLMNVVNLEDINSLIFQAIQAYDLQLQAQIYASGYDIITQLFGGIVLFNFNPFKKIWPQTVDKVKITNWEILNQYFHVFVHKKEGNSETIIKNVLYSLRRKNLFKRLYDISELLVDRFVEYMQNPKDMTIFCGLCDLIANQQSILLETDFGYKDILFKLYNIKGYKERWMVKTLGGGGNDTLLILGYKKEPLLNHVFSLLSLNSWEKVNIKLQDIKLKVQII